MASQMQNVFIIYSKKEVLKALVEGLPKKTSIFVKNIFSKEKNSPFFLKISDFTRTTNKLSNKY